MNRTLIRRIGLSLLALFVISVLCFLASGCQHAKPGPETAPLRAAIGAAKADIAGARADGKAIKRILSKSDYKLEIIIRSLEANP